MPNKEVLKDLREECECQNVKYCPLEVLLECHSERTLEQHKCIEIFKFLRSREEDRDLGWQESYVRWCREGYAEAFAEVYQDGMKHKELYQGIMKRMEKRDDGRKG